MHDKGLKELEYISQAVGKFPDLVQGGGGNTSVKLDDELMAVKASGYKLSQITTREGFAVVNYKNIKDYYSRVDLSSGIDYEKDSVEFVKNNVVEMEGLKKLRPSVEAGFHSILKKYVIHTHSVYANILCCAEEGRELVEKIFAGKSYACLWVPYINPGFSLTLKIKEGIEQCIKEKNRFPEVIFMENHGLVVSSDDCSKCVELHTEVNSLIKSYLKLGDDFPEIVLEKVDEGTYRSKTRYLAEFFKDSPITVEYFDEVALYPDQLVYLNDSICINGMDNKLNINTQTGEVIYKAGYQEALTIEETLVAYLYVIQKINACGLKIKTMSAAGKNFINNWESEKYRKSLLKSQNGQ